MILKDAEQVACKGLWARAGWGLQAGWDAEAELGGPRIPQGPHVLRNMAPSPKAAAPSAAVFRSSSGSRPRSCPQPPGQTSGVGGPSLVACHSGVQGPRPGTAGPLQSPRGHPPMWVPPPTPPHSAPCASLAGHSASPASILAPSSGLGRGPGHSGDPHGPTGHGRTLLPPHLQETGPQEVAGTPRDLRPPIPAPL